MLIYKNYDKAALDDQYHNRSKVPEFEDILQRWRDDSARLRRQFKSHQKLAYGPHPREYVDIFIPTAPAGRPVQVFFHGGYWQSLETDLFHFVAGGFVEQGLSTILVNYPLAPQASMTKIVDACRRALVWIYQQGAVYDYDPHQIYISGHSAGGHLVAMLLTTVWPTFAPDLPPDLIKGGCAISGLFNLEPIRLSYVNDQIGLDRAMARANSPVLLAPRSFNPLIVGVGGAESDEYLAQSRDLAAAWGPAGVPVREVIIADANHFTVLDALAKPDGLLNRAIMKQIRGR